MKNKFYLTDLREGENKFTNLNLIVVYEHEMYMRRLKILQILI